MAQDIKLKNIVKDDDFLTVDALIQIAHLARKLYKLNEKELMFIERILNEEDFMDICMIKMKIV